MSMSTRKLNYFHYAALAFVLLSGVLIATPAAIVYGMWRSGDVLILTWGPVTSTVSGIVGVALSVALYVAGSLWQRRAVD